jgi:hypothetical protein
LIDSEVTNAKAWNVSAKGEEHKARAMEEFEEKFIKPIVNASYPATLAGLDLAVLQFSSSTGIALNYTLLAGAMGFLLSAFSVFSYTIYPTRKKLWTSSALSFIAGLFCSILAVMLLILKPVIGSV